MDIRYGRQAAVLGLFHLRHLIPFIRVLLLLFQDWVLLVFSRDDHADVPSFTIAVVNVGNGSMFYHPSEEATEDILERFQPVIVLCSIPNTRIMDMGFLSLLVLTSTNIQWYVSKNLEAWPFRYLLIRNLRFALTLLLAMN